MWVCTTNRPYPNPSTGGRSRYKFPGLQYVAFAFVLLSTIIICRGRDISDGIATRYGLEGPGIESRLGGRDFLHLSQTSPGAHSAPYTMGTGSFPGVKRLGRGVDHPPPHIGAEVKERVELYLYSPSGSSWPVLG